jgi:hypothetical protein
MVSYECWGSTFQKSVICELIVVRSFGLKQEELQLSHENWDTINKRNVLHFLLFQIPDLKVLKAVAFTNHLHFNGDLGFG